MIKEQFSEIKTWLNELNLKRGECCAFRRHKLRDRFGLEEDFYNNLVAFINDDKGFAIKRHFENHENYDIEFSKS